LLLAIAGASMTRGATAACTDLPPSTLRLYTIKAPSLEEWRVPADALDHMPPADELGSRHTMMLTTSDVITLFEITHRIVPQADGSVCDAPGLVRIGFGAGRRIAYLARAAAADPCVRQKMLAHEEDHARRFNATVDRFIDEQTTDLGHGMEALKHMPAATAALAEARWEAGLRAIVEEAKRRLLGEVRAVNAETDDASTLAALADACGGKIRQLQEDGGL
jgi:hypothetical protein